MMVAMKPLATPLLSQRWTVFASVLGHLENGPIAGHDPSTARGIAFTPGLPLAHLTVEDLNGKRQG